MRASMVCVLLAGCGRIEFAAQADANGDASASEDGTVPGQCPAGFVPVPGNSVLGTSNFCVMQTEARAWKDTSGNSIAEPGELDSDGCPTVACDTDWSPAGVYKPASLLPVAADPWRSVSATVAFDACRSLGANYDLIANREWMTIARNAELDGRNWASGTPGSGRIVEGNTDDTNVMAIADPSDGYSGTSNDATQLPDVGWEQRRTLFLSNDAVIWDMPGNIQEWMDWTIGGTLDSPPSCTGGELPGFTCAGLANDDFQSTTGTYDSSQGVGIVIGGSGDAGRRGGQGGDRTQGFAGIYAFNMNRFTDDIFSGTGFRCVYRSP